MCSTAPNPPHVAAVMYCYCYGVHNNYHYNSFWSPFKMLFDDSSHCVVAICQDRPRGGTDKGNIDLSCFINVFLSQGNIKEDPG